MADRLYLILLAAVAMLIVSGCTERERMGYSAIPQNTPAGWEMSPFGSIQN